MEKTSRDELTQEKLREALHYDPLTGRFKWLVRSPGRKREFAGSQVFRKGKPSYVGINVGGENYVASRLAWFWMTGEWPPHEIDHKNLDKGDNSWENLRPATRQQNCHNLPVRSDSASGVKGVHWHKRQQRWRASITDPISRKDKYLGQFVNKQDAVAARKRAELELFGEFCYRQQEAA